MTDSCSREIQCIIHWFANWRHYEKREFMKALVDKAVPSNVSRPESQPTEWQ